MNTEILHPQLTIADVLKKWPQTYSVFRNRNMGCIGCLLQRFCSIQDVAETYEVDLPDLIEELEKCDKGIKYKGASNEKFVQTF
jgi:hybrid cluster-associated redox disulfide protein